MFRRFHKNLATYGVCLAIGLSSGVLGSLFLHSLQWVTELRLAHSALIWALPLVGLLIPFLYKTFGFGAEHGLKLVLEEIHRPQQLAPRNMAPLIFLTTLLTHLVGGSAGREGTALQMSASFGDHLAHFFKIPLQERRWVLIAALSGGFSAALGAPLAGMIFGMEVIIVGRLDRKILVECLIASFSAWATSVALSAPHFVPRLILPPEFSFVLFFHLLMLAILVGLASRFHVEGVRLLENIFKIIPATYRTLVGGSILLFLYLSFPLTEYQGLGLETIQDAFMKPLPLNVPLIKLLLTALTLAVGFKGGEFVPLVFIGATSANALANHWHEPLGFFAALGFVSLFGAAAKTPWTCAILTIEFFGLPIAPYAFLVTFAAYATAGPFGIYAGQKIQAHTAHQVD